LSGDEPATTRDVDRELPTTAYPTSHDGRRQFLIGAAAVTLGAAGAAAFGQKLSSADGSPRIKLPAPADAASAFPQGIEGKVRGITPLRTINAAFYRVDTNLSIPRVNPDTWQLRTDGMVERPMTLTYRQLMAMPMIERDITLTCVSNEVGGGTLRRRQPNPLRPLHPPAWSPSAPNAPAGHPCGNGWPALLPPRSWPPAVLCGTPGPLTRAPCS